MSTQLLEIKEQLTKLTELVNKLSAQGNQQEFSFTFDASCPETADTKRMRSNHIEFFRSLHEKFGFDVFDANDEFVLFMAYKCKINDLRETIHDIGQKRGFITITRSGVARSSRHKDYQFTKIFA